MAKVFGINTKIRGKVGEYIYRQTKVGTIVSEAPVKPITPLRTQSQMNIRTQWANLGAIYKQFDSMLRRGFEELPPQMSVYNAFIQANLGVVKVYITKRMKLNGGAILAPYQITRGSLPSISMTKNSNNKLVSSIALGSLTISATTTVAQFSQAVIDNNASFLEGDQITFFHGIQLAYLSDTRLTGGLQIQLFSPKLKYGWGWSFIHMESHGCRFLAILVVDG